MTVVEAEWVEANRHYLMAAVQIAIEELEFSFSDKNEGRSFSVSAEVFKNFENAIQTLMKPSRLDLLVLKLGLSEFEKKILLVCTGVELNSDYSQFIASLQSHEDLVHPSFNLLLAGFSSSHWDAISPSSPLRKWNLIHLANGSLLAKRSISIDEGILHYLTGFSYLEEQLSTIIKEVDISFTLAESQLDLVTAIHSEYIQRGAAVNIVELCGDNNEDKISVAKAICKKSGHKLYRIDALSIPQLVNDTIQLASMWNRQAILNDYALYIDCSRLGAEHTTQYQSLLHFAENTIGIIIVDRPSSAKSLSPYSNRYILDKPNQEEQKILWSTALRDNGCDNTIQKLVEHFNLSATTIAKAANEINVMYSNSPGSEEKKDLNSEENLWSVCCKYTRPVLDNLAQRMKTLATWDDIVLSGDDIKTMREIAMHVKFRSKVYKEGGFDQKTSRGLGISALFSGESGTGKTMAAEVIANELNLDLYRIDLSQVVNKYIGETEKNLKKIFDAAEEGGAILLFDEAESLFGKRNEVRDSHDRYSNIQVGYLLQRMENFNGLAILTTNMKNALDKAFERRIRFSMHFERPDMYQRKVIWSKAFPNLNWINGVDYNKLALINMPGGNIKNIAMNAAFLATAEHTKIGMSHLLQATKSEYKKLDKHLSKHEIKNWE